MAAQNRVFDVLEVASLARLALSPDEAERLRPQLGAILDAIAELEQLEARSDVASAQGPGAPLADDEPRAGLSRDEVLAQAPESAQGCFVVPRFVEGG